MEFNFVIICVNRPFKFQPCTLSLCFSLSVSSPQPWLGLFYRHPQSSLLWGGFSDFVELNCLFSSFGKQFFFWGDWTLNVPAIIELNTPICDHMCFIFVSQSVHVVGLSVCLECMNNDVPLVSELRRSYLFHGRPTCFHAGLIDPRWAASEHSATLAVLAEIVFFTGTEASLCQGNHSSR